MGRKIERGVVKGVDKMPFGVGGSLTSLNPEDAFITMGPTRTRPTYFSLPVIFCEDHTAP